jgi:hypothetical protein
MESVLHFSSIATNSRIDGGRGVIYGVSVITAGEAQGVNKGTFIDETTIAQIATVGNASPDGIPVKLSMQAEHDGSVGQYVARLINFRRDGHQCRADLELLSACPKEKEFVLELAQKMPSRFGLSVSMPNNHKKINGKTFLRCDELFTVDLVESPAANKGLFSAKPTTKTNMSEEIKYKDGDKGEHHEDCECKECLSMSRKEDKKKLSLFETAIARIEAAVTKLSAAPALAPAAPSAKSEAEIKLAKVEAEMEAIRKEAANSINLSKKALIDGLVAEATKLGKVIPMDNADLYTEKDGVITIGMEPEKLRVMLSKIPAGTVKLTSGTGNGGTPDAAKLDVWDTSEAGTKAWKAVKEQAVSLSRHGKK